MNDQTLHRPGRALRKSAGLLILFLGLAWLLASCTSQQEPARLRLALLPILDALPMYVAEEQGYFEEENLEVEFVPVFSAAERDQIIQAGQADGMINEILSTLFYNSETPEISIVRYARVATPEYPQYYILASPNGGITTLEQLRGKDIGISEGTIIEYTTERLLEAEGYAPDDFNIVAVPSIPDRLALLNSGELTSANLPDPFATLAIQGGALSLVDDSKYPEYGHSTISFRREVVEDSPEAIRSFLTAIEKAVADINQDKEQFSDLLVERQLVPEPLIGSYTIPDFPEASVPPQSQWDDVLAWARAKGYIDTEPAYADSVDSSFLPQ